MKILVIGSGAREHAIATTLLRSPLVEYVTVCPGNAGMSTTPRLNICNIDPRNHAQIISTIKQNAYDFCIIGPEQPLMDGLVDNCITEGIAVFGPTREAAQLEGSKDFAKRFMQRHNIPTAQFVTITDYYEAKSYVDQHGVPIVIKADGLAAGKGVTVAYTLEEAYHALADIFINRKFIQTKVVIEEYLEGEEFSLMCFANDTKFWAMPISQDHKRAYDGDKGPNTGGMGAYSPIPHIGQEVINTAIHTIIEPTLQGMHDEHMPFTGILYAGLMLTKEGPKVIEFNVRFGDPETESVLPLLTSDLAKNIQDILHGENPTFTWANDTYSVAVVLASEGYPTHAHTGVRLPECMQKTSHSTLHTANKTNDSTALTSAEHPVAYYYAGVKQQDNALYSSSGRVLVAQSSNTNLQTALNTVYNVLDKTATDGFFYRHDIAHQATELIDHQSNK